jgi:hypothetical protein
MPREDPGPQASRRIVYEQLRAKALERTRASLHLPPVGSPDAPFGDILEMGVSGGTATLALFAEGSASLYTSSGGGWIGGRGQPSIRDAALQAMEVAAGIPFQPLLMGLPELPGAGEHALYVLTESGLRGSRVPAVEFQRASHPLVPLWMACQDVLTQFRLLAPRRSG